MWIWLGHPAAATLCDPPALPWLADPGWATFGETMPVEANYLLLHENALDLTHFPHVHPGYSPAPYLAVPPPLDIAVSETSVSYYGDFPPARLVDWQAAERGWHPAWGRAPSGAVPGGDGPHRGPREPRVSRI